MFDKQIYIQRRDKLRAQFDHGVILMLGNDEASANYLHNHYKFRQDSSFLYFFGLDKPNLLAAIDIDNNQDYIFGDDCTMSDTVWMGKQPKMEDLVKSVGVINWMSGGQATSFFKEVIRDRQVVHFLPTYRSEQVLKIEDYLGIHHNEVRDYISEKLIRAVVSIRSYKTEEEVAEIEQTITRTTSKMFEAAMTMARAGMKEYEIAGKVEGIALESDSTLAYQTIATINGQVLHNNTYQNTLEDGRLFLMDAGAESPLHYATDITRTFPVSGTFTVRQKAIYNLVLKAELAAISLVKPGVKYRDIHLKVATLLTDGLKGLNLMKGDTEAAVKSGAHALFFPHGLGHMLGLDVHDMEGLGETWVGYTDSIRRSEQFGTAYLRLGRELEAGFVITVEPGLYFIPELIDQWKRKQTCAAFINYDEVEKYRDFGGIRIEDDVLVTANSCRVLGKPIPKTIEEIEAVMAK